MREHRYFVYVMASESGTLYVGMSNSLVGRVFQHKAKLSRGFTAKYGCSKLIYFEEYAYVYDAITREKQIKSWRREKKEALIRSVNHGWRDLSLDWEGF